MNTRPRSRHQQLAVNAVQSALKRWGLTITRVHQWEQDARTMHEYLGTVDFPEQWQDIVERTRPYTLTSPERIGGLIAGVEHVVQNRVPGAIAECGIWRGGSSMAAALTLMRLGEVRDLYLYDTFEGMPEPGKLDVDLHGFQQGGWNATQRKQAAILGRATLDDVAEAMRSTGYPADQTHLVRGMVEDTIPESAPPEIALLRLDTDFYASTRHELMHLWDRIPRGGVLIIDDYGHLQGARKAVDEFFDHTVFLHRLDYSGRLIIK